MPKEKELTNDDIWEDFFDKLTVLIGDLNIKASEKEKLAVRLTASLVKLQKKLAEAEKSNIPEPPRVRRKMQ